MDDVLNIEPEVYTQLCDGGAGGKHGVGWAAMRAADLPVYIKVGWGVMRWMWDGMGCVGAVVRRMVVCTVSTCTKHIHTKPNETNQALDSEAFPVAQRLVLRGETRYHCNEVRKHRFLPSVYIYGSKDRPPTTHNHQPTHSFPHINT